MASDIEFFIASCNPVKRPETVFIDNLTFWKARAMFYSTKAKKLQQQLLEEQLKNKQLQSDYTEINHQYSCNNRS
jgi:hypothetical protein